MVPDQEDITAVDSRLDAFLGALGPLSTINSVAQKVLQLLARDFGPNEPLKTIIKLDPVLTAAVLSTAAANSLEATTIEQAWQVLPAGEIISSVLTTAVHSIDIQPHSSDLSQFDRTELWRHSLAVALISRAVAEQLSVEATAGTGSSAIEQIASTELAYSAGLLHDLGTLALSASMPKSLERAWELARTSGSDLLDAERQIFDFDHTALGRRLAQNLHLPSVFSKCIWLHHHSCGTWPEQLSKESVVPVVIFANTLACELSLGKSGNLDFPSTACELAGQIGLSPDFLAKLSQNIPEELDEANRVLGFDESPQPGQYIQALAQIVSNIAKVHAQLNKVQVELSEAEDISQRFAEITRQAARKLDRKILDAELAQVATGAAHELNNPLAVIAGRSQILAQQETDPKKKEALKLIEQQARQASDIASELLATVQPPTPKPQPTNLEPIIRKLCAALAGKAQATNSKVICELPSDLPPAFIDPDMFEKSLLEILKNALTALGSQPGSIHITCRLNELQEKLLLEVADSGIGMEAAVARNAFVPFFSSLPAGRGRGLGLSRAKAFIEANQGRLWLRSRPGEGTTVWMALPLAKEG